ncbi:MAG: hypothetical protein HXS49_06185, partial [Theionarchaea archaeon]|nr:hypothetical protein [Theionarchaea archaeon]
RIAVPGKNLAEITLVLQDKPGVLADVALELGNADINILFNESDEIRFSNLSALLAIIDMSRSRISVEELKTHFEKMKVVKQVEIRQLG